MKHATLACFLTFASVLLVCAEISTHQDQNKVEIHTGKDLKDAKERWIQNDEDLWDDDMMQHPIDEGPRRVSAPTWTKYLAPGYLRFPTARSGHRS